MSTVQRRMTAALQFLGLRHTEESKARWNDLTARQKTARMVACVAAGFFGVTLINLKMKFGF